VGIGVAAILVAGYTSASRPGGTRLTLNGNQEVPTVNTAAYGRGMITVDADQSIKGTVSTNGIAATAAHIHLAPMGSDAHKGGEIRGQLNP
jgi:hypothetical protein